VNLLCLPRFDVLLCRRKNGQPGQHELVLLERRNLTGNRFIQCTASIAMEHPMFDDRKRIENLDILDAMMVYEQCRICMKMQRCSNLECVSSLGQPKTPHAAERRTIYHLQLLLQNALHPPLHRVHVLRRGNIVLASRLSTCKRQILGHDAIDIYRVNASLL
jgi:hypothetical protein